MSADRNTILQRIAELRADNSAMTPGPWEWDDRDGCIRGPETSVVAFGEPTSEGNHRVCIDDLDATGIARTRNALTSTADMLEALLKRVESHEVVLRELENMAATGNQTAVTRQPDGEGFRSAIFRDIQKLAREALGPGSLRIEEHAKIDELTIEVEKLTAELDRMRAFR